MTFRISLFNKKLIGSDLKRFWWISALYGLFLFLILPLGHMMQEIPANIDQNWIRETLQRSLDIFSGQSILQTVLICIVPVLLAVLLFSYLHNSRATAVLHSLPFDRKTLFCSHVAAGLVLLLLPVIANGLVLVILQTTTRLHAYYSLLDILQWAGHTALFNSLFFAITVFVGMFTGHAGAQIAFAYILQILPTGLCLLFTENLRRLLYGYAEINRGNILAYDFPLMMLGGGVGQSFFTVGNSAIYLLVAVLFLVAAACVYKLRPAETAGEVIAFTSMRPVFKYGVTTCTMLLAGIYFAGTSGGTLPTIILGYVIGSLLGYWTAEALLQKSLQVWSAYKGYLGYAAVIAVLLLGIATDVTGFVRRVPDPGQVEKAYLGYNINRWVSMEKMQNSAAQSQVYGDGYFFTEKENIENITLLHRRLLQKPRVQKGAAQYVAAQYIAYTLHNGTHLLRQYNIDEQEHAAALRPVYESSEYKEARFPVLVQNPAEIKWVEINDYRTSKRPVLLADSEEIDELATRLRQDLLGATTFEELANRKTGSSTMEESACIVITDLDEIKTGYALRPGYKAVLNWLKEKGYYEQALLQPEEIEYVELSRTGAAPRQVTIKDPQLIEELLNLKGSFDYQTGPDELIRAIFHGKTADGPFQFLRFIHRDWPAAEISTGLHQYLEELR